VDARASYKENSVPVNLKRYTPSIASVVSLAILPFFPSPARAQTLMQGSGPGGLVRTFSTDAAILETQEPRKDLPCTVNPLKPSLGFDLRFHAGYEVMIPLKELAGSEDVLTMIFRVTASSRTDGPVYFSQRVSVPKIEENADGKAYLQGYFDLGEGNYHVDWLMRDRAERVCSSYFDLEAAVPIKDGQVDLPIAPATIQAADQEPFRDEPPVARDETDGPLNVKVMVNFAPQKSASATLQPLDTGALVSILRRISREPRICKFSVVAFNMQEKRVIYRQENSEQINFPALGEALNSLNLGTVDFKQLGQKHADSDFLSTLIAQEMVKDHPDAVIFAGPKIMLDEKLPPEPLNRLVNISYPVFYMNYILNPQANPWRDAIGNTVKRLKGYEYTISRPKDLWVAWSEIMSHIVKLRTGTGMALSSSQ